jgi:hypothetical protein
MIEMLNQQSGCRSFFGDPADMGASAVGLPAKPKSGRTDL